MRSSAVLLGVALWLVAVAAGGVTIEVGSVEARRGQDVDIPVFLHTDGRDVAGIENQLDLASELQALECRVNPDINRTESGFSLQNECYGYAPCGSLKALILSFSDLSPLDDGSVLYWCRVRVEPTAQPGQHPVLCLLPGVSTPDGELLPVRCEHGSVTVSNAPPVPTRHITATPTSTPAPTRPPTTPRPSTPTRTSTPTPNSSHLVDVWAFPSDISAEHGGRIEILASVCDSNGWPLNGVPLEFDHHPAVGQLSATAEESGFIDFDGWFVDGRARVELDIPPGRASDTIEVSAKAPGGSARVEIELYSGSRPAPTPYPTAYPGASASFIFIETSHLSIDSRAGGKVTVWAHVFGRYGPIYGADLVFDFFPEPGELEIVSEITGPPVEINGITRFGVGEASLVIPALPIQKEVLVAASWRGHIGQVSIPIVFEAATRVGDVIVQTAGGDCVKPDPFLHLDVAAQVLDVDGNPIDDVEVLFESDLTTYGRQFAYPTATVDGLVTATLRVRDGIQPRIDHATGEAVPYTIKARTGGVEGTTHVYVRSDGSVCRSAARALAGPEEDNSGCAVTAPSGRPHHNWLLLLIVVLRSIAATRHSRRDRC